MRGLFGHGGGLAAATLAIAAATSGAAVATAGLRDALLPLRHTPTTPPRGKHKARRHGAKMRSNLRHVSRRTRRKHRRAGK